MAMPEVLISGHGMTITDSIRDYIEKKFEKYENIFEMATSINVECVENVAADGVDKDFRVEVTMNLPKAVARVEKNGADLYAIVDKITDVLVRKVKRYKGKLNQWEGREEWKDVEEFTPEEIEAIQEEPLITYEPKVISRKVMKTCSPISEAEAIERMEMLGYDSFLFKNERNDKFCMIYRRKKGGYGIVEAC